MPPLTATRPGNGQYHPIFVHTVEKRIAEVADLRAKRVPIISMLESLGLLMQEDGGYSKLQPILTENNTPVTPYGSGVTPPIFMGGYAGTMRTEYASYLAPVGWEYQDELNRITSEAAAVNVATVRTYNALKAMGETMEADIVGGNASNALRMTGLEQLIHATTHLAATDTLAEILNADDWNFRQCANTVQGIARTAMSGPNSGGPRLMNNMCIAFDDIGVSSGSRAFGLSSGELNDVCKIFEHFYLLSCSGSEYPDLIWSTQRPMSDARRCGQAFVSFQVTDKESPQANIGPGGLRYGAATWYAMPTLRATGLNGGAAVAGDDMIYLINSAHIGFELDADHAFEPVFEDWQWSHSPLGRFQHYELRGQLLSDMPGMHSVVARYGT
jgi:hypothetical protein